MKKDIINNKLVDSNLNKTTVYSNYKSGKISISELSRELGLDIWTLTDYLKENNIKQDITYEELKENEKNFNKICAIIKK